MELRIDSWGIVFESGIADLYLQRSALVSVLAIFVGLQIWKFYKNTKQKVVKKPRETPTKRKLDI